MVEVTVENPFGAEEIAEIPLANAPLARVLAQVRFPRLSALMGGDETSVHAFAAAVRSRYPVLEEQRELAVTITPEGVSQAPGNARVWQLRSADEQWQVSFGDSFLAVDTAAYVSREDFAQRLIEAWAEFANVVDPPSAQRVGFRYINRIADPDILGDLGNLVRPEALGGAALAGAEGVTLSHSMHEAVYQFDDANGLQARWGLLPAGATLDPTLAPAGTQSWVLDLDAFRTGRLATDPAQIGAHVHELADRAYRYFRWVVTPTFLARFGGDVR